MLIFQNSTTRDDASHKSTFSPLKVSKRTTKIKFFGDALSKTKTFEGTVILLTSVADAFFRQHVSCLRQKNVANYPLFS